MRVRHWTSGKFLVKSLVENVGWRVFGWSFCVGKFWWQICDGKFLAENLVEMHHWYFWTPPLFKNIILKVCPTCPQTDSLKLGVNSRRIQRCTNRSLRFQELQLEALTLRVSGTLLPLGPLQPGSAFPHRAWQDPPEEEFLGSLQINYPAGSFLVWEEQQCSIKKHPLKLQKLLLAHIPGYLNTRLRL